MYTTYRTVMSVYLICAVTNPCVFHRLFVASWNAVWSEDAPPGCSHGPPRTPVRWEPRGAAWPTRAGHGAQPQETCPLPTGPATAERPEPGQKVSHTARICPRSNPRPLSTTAWLCVCGLSPSHVFFHASRHVSVCNICNSPPASIRLSVCHSCRAVSISVWAPPSACFGTATTTVSDTAHPFIYIERLSLAKCMTAVFSLFCGLLAVSCHGRFLSTIYTPENES
jgi:hypothetical protein